MSCLTAVEHPTSIAPLHTLQSFGRRLGIEPGHPHHICSYRVPHIFCDSLCWFGCRESGRIRHVEIRLLWLQKRLAENEIVLQKQRGCDKPADPSSWTVRERSPRCFSMTSKAWRNCAEMVNWKMKTCRNGRGKLLGTLGTKCLRMWRRATFSPKKDHVEMYVLPQACGRRDRRTRSHHLQIRLRAL